MPNAFWATLSSCFSYLSIDEAITSISNSLAEISNELNTETDGPRFYTQKDDLADAAFDVGFVHSFCHQNYVSSLCFSCDGSYLALAVGEGSIVMYEVESCTKYCELREYASQYGSYERPAIFSMCFSANGRYLAVSDYDNRVTIWDVQNKRIRNMFQVHFNNVLSEIRLSPDGRLVAVRDGDMALLVLNMRDNSRKMASQCRSFDFNPNGRHIAMGNGSGDLAILDVRTGKAVKRWDGHRSYLNHVQFTSDGKGLLCSYHGVIEHWDVNYARPVLIMKSDAQNYSYLKAISPENRLLACSNELWDINSGKRQCTLEGHDKRIYSIDFSTAGTYFAMGSFDGFASLWKYTWA